MRGLLSCPFCRELYSHGEATRCPHCDIPLVDLGKLPPSLEGEAERAALGPVDPPEDRPFGHLYFRRGKGALLGLGLLGLWAFFQPWFTVQRPDALALSGYDLARANVTWLWGGAIGWFLLLPLVASRRSVSELRGIRVIAATFPAMTVGEAALLFFRAPTEQGYFSTGLEPAFGLFASFFVGALAVGVAVRLGGSLTDLRDLPGADLGDRHPGEAIH